ncbi:PqiC family protein [Thiocapsa bogorovii]|uniref:PqiC family protein n=1 Tax=Thiocapsa bogorovii TaxID=521689 RepID=UPI001E2A0A3E|nr:PqiC family protein [Thiocapsa bogorovii]UHD17268.1 PqiC family protein [Thiocapsa bogorovii]
MTLEKAVRCSKTFILVLCALATGCASAPTRFYTLSSTLTPTGGSDALSVSVGPVSIPAQVDRPQIVVSEGPNRVVVDETSRWASPLSDAIAGVVAANLIALLGTQKVTLFPQVTSANADYRVAIEVQTFESAPGSTATLSAVWSVRRKQDGRTQSGRTSVREPVSDTGYEALAAAHSRALTTLSRDIADALRTLSRSPATPPPT